MGDVTVDVRRNGEQEKITETGLWEQYFLGNNKEATIEGVRYPVEA